MCVWLIFSYFVGLFMVVHSQWRSVEDTVYLARHKASGTAEEVTISGHSCPQLCRYLSAKNITFGRAKCRAEFLFRKVLLYAKSHLRSWRRKKHTHGCGVTGSPAPPRAKVWQPILAWRLGVVGCGRTLNPLCSVALLTPLDWRSGTNNRLTPEHNGPVLIRTTPAFRPPGFCTMVIMVIGIWYYRDANMSARIIPAPTLATLVHITDRRSDRRYDLVGIHG